MGHLLEDVDSNDYVDARIIVDGKEYRCPRGPAKWTETSSDFLRYYLTLSLPQGTHSALLQWNIDGIDDNVWKSIMATNTAFEHHEDFILLLNEQTNNARLILPVFIDQAFEDTELRISDIFIDNIPASIATEYLVGMTIRAANGTITLPHVSSLSFSLGNGNGDRVMKFSGPVSEVNLALQSIIYRGLHDWHGIDTVTCEVKDLMYIGSNATLMIQKYVFSVNVRSVNDIPVLITPSAQEVNITEELTIIGTKMFDPDVLLGGEMLYK
eukprot:1242772-Ditylum_brightwellii.AAC.1